MLPEMLRKYQYADFTKGPTAQAVAKLMGGLKEVAIHLPKDQVMSPIDDPEGLPAQAPEVKNRLTVLPMARIAKQSNWMVGIRNRLSSILGVERSNYWKNLLCPRCLTKLETIEVSQDNECPNCRLVIPGTYIANYETANPFFIQVFGWTQHGKTVYLNSFTTHAV